MYDFVKEDKKMYFENTSIENIVVDQEFLTDILKKYGLECHGAWDYDRMTFDRRFDVREGRFYLRVFCDAISGDVGAHDATLKILKPALGKYYYPHGVEYTDEVFPSHLVKDCEQILDAVAKELAKYGIVVKNQEQIPEATTKAPVKEVQEQRVEQLK